MRRRLKPTVEDPNEKLKRLFGDDVPYYKMTMTQEGEYSITPKYERQQIISEMRDVIGKPLKDMSIMDGTAGNGGDTIEFAMNYMNVVAVELNEANFKVLSSNVEKAYNSLSASVVFINDNLLARLKGCTEDVLYIDPPWGGKQYKESESIDLRLEYKGKKISVGTILSSMSLQRSEMTKRDRSFKPEYFFVKAPINVDTSTFPTHRVSRIMNKKGVLKFLLIYGKI